MGKVYLVGAGPGAKELLTLKAHDILRKADVVVYDRLVGEEIMDLIPEVAIKINVGKNVGNHAVPQEEINSILADHGEKYETVVRLKGGDPFVFGRGGEELEMLVERGVAFEVVPGITSSIAAPMYGGIPVTHRDFCSSFHIITGHAKKDMPIQIDYDSLVKLHGTLIFMMSVASAPEIAKGLLQAGIGEDMPFAFIENATRPYQRKFTGELCNIEAVIQKNKICSPAVFLVGRVCALSDTFDWFSTKPLKNKRIIVTQPKKNASKLAAALKDNGADVRLLPMIQTSNIRPLQLDMGGFDTLVFTSSVGVRSYFEALLASGLDARAVYGKKIACVGTETAATLKQYGLIADFIPSYFDGVTLAREMIEGGFVTRNSNVALLRAKKGSEEILQIFTENNIVHRDFAVYETENLPCTRVDLGAYDLVTFTSKSCVEGFIENFKGEDFGEITALCIGKQTGKLAQDLGFTTIVSEMPTIDSMVKKVLEIC